MDFSYSFYGNRRTSVLSFCIRNLFDAVILGKARNQAGAGIGGSVRLWFYGSYAFCSSHCLCSDAGTMGVLQSKNRKKLMIMGLALIGIFIAAFWQSQ